jgi:hypothetical protein
MRRARAGREGQSSPGGSHRLLADPLIDHTDAGREGTQPILFLALIRMLLQEGAAHPKVAAPYSRLMRETPQVSISAKSSLLKLRRFSIRP